MKENITHRSTFAIIFILNRSKMKKNGMCPILGRISVDAKAVQFSTKIDSAPNQWDAKVGRVIGDNEKNKHLTKLDNRVRDLHAEILSQQGYVTADLIKNGLNGVCCKLSTLLALYDEHNDEYAKRIGVDRAKSSHMSYVFSRKHLAAYIIQRYNVDDIPLRYLDFDFIDKFDFFLRVDRSYSDGYIVVQIKLLRKIIRRAISQGSLNRDPFFLYVLQRPEPKCRHLRSEEIDTLLSLHIESKRLCFTRDLFVFAMFTGLSYADLKNLSTDHIKTDKDGVMWIIINRRKSGVESNIRLLDIPIKIMGKYQSERSDNKIFNVVSKRRITVNLNKIAKLANIAHFTMHQARHNFASHITLSQGVPMETVSKMMGHKSIRTTQIYAKLSDKKVNEDMKNLSYRLRDKFSIYEDLAMPIGVSQCENFKQNKCKTV